MREREKLHMKKCKMALLLVLCAASVFAADKRYLRYTPEQYRAMVPRHSTSPVTTESSPFATSGNNDSTCPFCGKTGKRFNYDFLSDPERMTCTTTGRDILSYPAEGSLEFTDWKGNKYSRDYIVTTHIKSSKAKPEPVMVFPQNLLAREKIIALLGRFSGGALPILADGYAETGDEAYAERAIAILEGFADVFPAWPWSGHSCLKPLTEEELDEKGRRHESGYHGWQGPARLAAGVTSFRNPEEALYFTRMARAFKKLEKSTSWRGRKEKIVRDLFREGARHFYAYGAKQCVGNAIGMYAPALYELGTILGDDYLLDGFRRIMEDFLYNENHYDGLSTEGSPDYARMVSGMWRIFHETSLASNAAWRARNPFFETAGRTVERVRTSSGGTPALGDQHAHQYEIKSAPANPPKPGGEYGGWGLSVIRAGSADRRLDLYFSHDRCAGHSHDDTLGLQFYYRGIPLLEQYGDTRSTLDLTDAIPHAADFAKLEYPAPIVRHDPRPRGFSLQDMTTGLTKNLVIVDDYWAGNSWYTAYRGGQGVSRRAPYGRLNVRTGMRPESDFQFVEAEGVDVNTVSYQGVDVYRRSLCVVTRPDGTPYVVDFFSIAGGHRHLFLLHSRGRETASTLGRGKKYDHLDSIPGEAVADSFIVPAGSVLFPSNVLNNVDLGPVTKGTWRHEWTFDYAAWASKTLPPDGKLLVKPHVLSVYGFHSPASPARAIRAEGHFPLTIEEKFGGSVRKHRFQFENAIRYAGLRAESRSCLKDTYMQVYEMRQEDEAREFTEVKRILPDDGDTFAKAAVAIRFRDGTADIVFWQAAARSSSWRGGRIRTDARSALLRLKPDGSVARAKIVGGTFLDYGGRRVAELERGLLLANVVSAKDGEITVSDAPGWTEGDALAGRTLVVDFPFGRRRETFTVSRIERVGANRRIVLEGAPFFTYHRGEVLDVADKLVTRASQFIGTTVQKGGQTTRYLHGARLEFPQIGLSAHVGGVCCQSGHMRLRYETLEDIDLEAAGVKPGMEFKITPDWTGATVRLTEESR